VVKGDLRTDLWFSEVPTAFTAITDNSLTGSPIHLLIVVAHMDRAETNAHADI